MSNEIGGMFPWEARRPHCAAPGAAGVRPFDIGHVPEGWTRGERLTVTPPNDPLAGFVRQEDIGFLAAGEEPNHEHIYRLAFTSGEGARVAAWLQWWHAED